MRQAARALGSPLDPDEDRRCWPSATRCKYAGPGEEGIENRRWYFWKIQSGSSCVNLQTDTTRGPSLTTHTHSLEIFFLGENLKTQISQFRKGRWIHGKINTSYKQRHIDSVEPAGEPFCIIRIHTHSHTVVSFYRCLLKCGKRDTSVNNVGLGCQEGWVTDIFVTYLVVNNNMASPQPWQSPVSTQKLLHDCLTALSQVFIILLYLTIKLFDCGGVYTLIPQSYQYTIIIIMWTASIAPTSLWVYYSWDFQRAKKFWSMLLLITNSLKLE